MTKYIVMMADKYGCGSYGVGDTMGEAKKKARTHWPGGRIVETRTRTTEVPEGHKLIVRCLVDGIEWYSVPERETDHGSGT